MKYLIIVCVVTCTFLLVVPAQAQLALYDNFNAKFIDESKWFGSIAEPSGIVNYEFVRRIAAEPTYLYKGLNLTNRRFGRSDTETGDSGSSAAVHRLVFRDGSNIRQIQATVQVKAADVTGCASNPSGGGSVGARIGGNFFNTGIVTTTGSAMNDVGVYIELRRPITDTAKVLKVYAYVTKCTSADCGTSDVIGTVQDLGTTKINKRVKILLTWDQTLHQFVFKKDKDPDVVFDYNSVLPDDTHDPGSLFGGLKRLDTRQSLANCYNGGSGPRTYGYIDAFFDDVKVNADWNP
jgi:hypothetical protein